MDSSTLILVGVLTIILQLSILIVLPKLETINKSLYKPKKKRKPFFTSLYFLKIKNKLNFRTKFTILGVLSTILFLITLPINYEPVNVGASTMPSALDANHLKFILSDLNSTLINTNPFRNAGFFMYSVMFCSFLSSLFVGMYAFYKLSEQIVLILIYKFFSFLFKILKSIFYKLTKKSVTTS